MTAVNKPFKILFQAPAFKQGRLVQAEVQDAAHQVPALGGQGHRLDFMRVEPSCIERADQCTEACACHECRFDAVFAQYLQHSNMGVSAGTAAAKSKSDSDCLGSTGILRL